MTYVIIQIPCLNESETLPQVIKDLPSELKGIERLEYLVVDDGSTDNTAEVARELGVHHIIQNIGNRGLGNSFQIGADHALALGADIVVNTDGDHQYPGQYIAALIDPILSKQADIVVGDRQTSQIKHFGPIKRFFQWLGTKITILLAGNHVIKDAVSGFRAYSREALLEINVTSEFSYVLDSTIQASNKKLKMVTIPITVNDPTRPSRLFKNMGEHIQKSGTNLLRTFAFYRPLRLFFGLGIFLFIVGIIPIIRFLYFYFFTLHRDGNIQSLIIGSILLSMSFNCFALGIIGDLMSRNRKLVERILKIIKSSRNQ